MVRRPARQVLTVALGLLCAQVATAEKSTVQLLPSRQELVTAEGVVRFPFSFQSVAPESAEQMRDDPVIQTYFNQIKRLGQSNGYVTMCTQRHIYLLRSANSGTLAGMTNSWISTVQRRPTFYQPLGKASFGPQVTQGETITGKLFAFSLPQYPTLIRVYAFYTYQKAGLTWVLECSGRRD